MLPTVRSGSCRFSHVYSHIRVVTGAVLGFLVAKLSRYDSRIVSTDSFVIISIP